MTHSAMTEKHVVLLAYLNKISICIGRTAATLRFVSAKSDPIAQTIKSNTEAAKLPAMFLFVYSDYTNDTKLIRYRFMPVRIRLVSPFNGTLILSVLQWSLTQLFSHSLCQKGWIWDCLFTGLAHQLSPVTWKMEVYNWADVSTVGGIWLCERLKRWPSGLCRVGQGAFDPFMVRPVGQ